MKKRINYKPRYWDSNKRNKLQQLWETERNMSVILAEFPDRTYAGINELACKYKFIRLVAPKDFPNYLKIAISDTDAAWLAGFIDGEGCIAVYPCTKGRRHYTARLGIANTNLMVLNKIKNMIHTGRVNTLCRKPPRKTSYQLQVSGLVAVYSVLIVILPFLQVKKTQAELVKEYIEFRFNMARKASNHLDENIIYTELKYLNCKGVELEENEDRKDRDNIS